MKHIAICSFAFAAFMIAACTHTKKSTTTTASTTPPPVAAPPAAPAGPAIAGPSFVDKTKVGAYAPGNDELLAIQAKHKEVTMDNLNQGYALYTGVCTNCHGIFSIYQRPEDAWPQIIDDMAKKAELTAPQKDAVYNYVMSVKAAQAAKGK